MHNLYKYLLIILIVSPLFNQEVGENDVVLSKDDLYEIAESLIDIGDINNAISIYQQILDYQIRKHGTNHIEVANLSDLIGELLILSYRLEDAEIYLTQSLKVRSRLLFEQQVALKPSLEFLRNLYIDLSDSLKVEFIENNLSLLNNANMLSLENKDWSPLTFGLDMLSDKDVSDGELSFQATNLLEISESYFDAGLYHDAIDHLIKALSVNNSNISIDYIYYYINKHIDYTPEMINALINYNSLDSTYFGQEKLLLSVIYYYRAEEDLANEYIKQYTELNQSDILAYQLLGDYAYNNEDYLSALFNYRKSRQFDSNNEYTISQEALTLYNLGYYNEAINLFGDMIVADPYNFDAYYYRALSHEKINNYKNAINDFTQYILLNPDNEEIYYHLGICYYNTEKFNRSKESLERYLKFNNENGEAHYILGIINEEILELETAIFHYSQATKFNPKLIESNLKLGMLHYRNQNYRKALEPIRDYIIHNPDSIAVLEKFADILFREKRFPESIDAYERLYSADSTQVDYLYNIANAHIELNDMENAKEMLTKYILLGKVDSEILHTLANIESELGDYKNSILHYQMAINIGQPTVSMYYNLAMSYAQLGNFLEALQAFKNAYELDNQDFEIIYQIAICYKELEVYDEAINYLALFLEEYPKDYLAHYVIGEIYFFNKNYNLAASHFKKSVSMNSNDYVSLYYLGMCSAEQNDFLNAAKFYKKSIKINPEHGPSHFELALTYNNLGKEREVKKQKNIIKMLDRNLYSQLIEELDKD